MASKTTKIADVVKPLSWLVGTWKSVNACCMFPTMKEPVKYNELLTFSSIGDPFLIYNSLTWDEKNTKYMHVEGGHLRIMEDGCSVTLLTSQNFGICSVEDGKLENNSIQVDASVISHSKFCPKKVCGIRRCFCLNKEGKLEYKMCLQTEDVPLTEHLVVCYEKLNAKNKKKKC
ncbi:peroxynitrite isomerase THAP4-like [Diabrotica undecimpunctata]|uniref:peroxynitrite isomerase THAP4-like n=1 Tax=Diabrotica undecimpunctata TaxID=50387 RepID=UPI003B632614